MDMYLHVASTSISHMFVIMKDLLFHFGLVSERKIRLTEWLESSVSVLLYILKQNICFLENMKDTKVDIILMSLFIYIANTNVMAIETMHWWYG
jgi:hypothetical protein